MSYPFGPRPSVEKFIEILKGYEVDEFPVLNLRVLVTLHIANDDGSKTEDMSPAFGGRSVLQKSPNRIWVIPLNRKQIMGPSLIRSACEQLGIDVKSVVELGMDLG